MAWPAGVTLCSITIGPVVNAKGEEATLTAEVTFDSPSRVIVHAESGTSALASAGITDPAALLTVGVPHVDQDGFIGPDGAPITMWGYTFTVLADWGSGRRQTFTKRVQPLVGQTAIDLDLVSDGTFYPPVAGPTLAVSSVAGLTGVVAAEDLVTELPIADPVAAVGAAITSADPTVVDPLNAAIAGRKVLGAPSLRGYGHSYMYGSTTAGTPAIIGVTDLLSVAAAGLGLPQDNRGVSGASLGDAASAGDWADIFQAETRGTTFEPVGGAYAVMYGLNDAAQIGHLYSELASFKSALRAVTARMRCATIFEDSHSSVVLGGSGTWSSYSGTGRNSGSGCRYNNTAGGTVTITPPSGFPGGTISIPLVAWGDGGSAVWTTTVNGITYTVDTADFARTGNHPTVGLMRIPNVKRTNGAITLTVSSVSASGAARAVFDCWGWEPADEASCPAVALVAQPKPLDYTSQSGAPAGEVTDAGVDVINQIIDEVVTEFGGRVLYVDTSHIDKNTNGIYWEAGNVHPNAAGHAYIAAQIDAAISEIMTVVPTPAKAVSVPGAGTAYTPAIDGTGTTQGNATVAGKYWNNGGVISFRATITLGSTTVIGSALRVSLPVNEASGTVEIGAMTCRVFRSGDGYYTLAAQMGTATGLAQIRLAPRSVRSLSVTTTTTDATVTAAAGSFTAADVGARISGTGIPSGATIASVTNSGEVELSAVATASATVDAALHYKLVSPTASTPLPWASGDVLYLSGAYEAA